MESEALAGTAAPTAVVWTAPGEPVPGELKAALKKGGLRVAPARGVYTALAALCRLDRVAAADPRAQCALVLVNPAGLDSPAALCGAAEKYASRTRFWMYITGATRLRAVTPEDLRAWGGQAGAAEAAPAAKDVKARPYKPQTPQSRPGRPAVTITGAAGGVRSRTGSAGGGAAQAVDAGPKLRLAGDASELKLEAEGSGADAPAGGETGKDARSRPVLSPEELEMLLREEDED